MSWPAALLRFAGQLSFKPGVRRGTRKRAAMPKDAWKRARDKDRVLRSQREAHVKRVRRHKPRKGPGAYSGSTVLWFGRFKGQPVRAIPEDYLRWLASQASTSPNVTALAAWLRRAYIPTLA
jgi:hypothetical protein